MPAWQCLRYVSRLRLRLDPGAVAQGGVIVAAHVDDAAGHFGAAGASGQSAQLATEYAFLFKALGLDMK